MRASFQSGRQCWHSSNTDSMAAPVLPSCASRADLQGRTSCLPFSLCAGESLQYPTLTWDNHSYNCLLGCTAINSLQVLFLELVTTQTTLFLCQEYKLFKSSGNLDPNWAGFRCHVSGHLQNVYGRTDIHRPPSWGEKCYVFSLWLEWSVTETSFSLAKSSLAAF